MVESSLSVVDWPRPAPPSNCVAPNTPGPLTIVSDETHLPYDRPPLSKEVLRNPAHDVVLKPQEFYDDNDITLRLAPPRHRSTPPRRR